MNTVHLFNCDHESPEVIVDDQLSVFQRSSEQRRLIAVEYVFEQYWLPSKPTLSLTAIYEFSRENDAVIIVFSVAQTKVLAHINFTGYTGLAALCEAYDLPLFFESRPVMLTTVAIKKPWGQEIWYTGVEERGVVSVKATNGIECLLPWYLSLLPSRLSGRRHQSLILLKILDPLPDPVLGDLYFELHQQKQEVYVVTAVDESAWPKGVGKIRFGFDQQKLQTYKNDECFRQDFLASVKAYEQVRRSIDRCLAAFTGIPQADAQQKALDAGLLSEELLAKERLLRASMDAYTQELPLKVGDVVKVPCLLPHSLQHGVRTVEFQTPVYERLILSFAQQVLTQSHWDTEEAARLMTLRPAAVEKFRSTQVGAAIIEQIVDFSDFEVHRVSVPTGESVDIALEGDYILLMAVIGDVDINGLIIEAESAVFLPKSWNGAKVINNQPAELCFLLAYPK